MKVILDTNCLYSFYLRDLFLTLAEAEIIQFHWSGQIKRELIDNLVATSKCNRNQAEKLVEIISSAFPDASVKNYKNLIGKLNCSDINDEHVLAAAITVQADYLVTFNLKDFPKNSFENYGLRIVSPDDYLVFLTNLLGEKILQIVFKTISKYKSPPIDLSLYAEVLKNIGCPKFALLLK